MIKWVLMIWMALGNEFYKDQVPHDSKADCEAAFIQFQHDYPQFANANLRHSCVPVMEEQ